MTTISVTETARWRTQLWVRQSWYCFKIGRIRLGLLCLREAARAARGGSRVVQWESTP